MENTCAKKLKKIEAIEAQKSFIRSRRIVVPGTVNRRMTTEEYQLWRDANKMKR